MIIISEIREQTKFSDLVAIKLYFYIIGTDKVFSLRIIKAYEGFESVS